MTSLATPITPKVFPAGSGRETLQHLYNLLDHRSPGSFSTVNEPHLPFLRQQWEQLIRPGCRLSQTFPGLSEYTQMALEGALSIGDYTDFYGLVICVQLGWDLPNNVVTLVGMEQVFSNSETNPLLAIVRQGLSDAERFLPYVLTLQIPKGSYRGCGCFLEYFRTATSFLERRMLLQHDERDQSCYEIPTVSLWQQVLKAYVHMNRLGEDAIVTLSPVIGANEREVMQMRRQRSHPVGLEVEDTHFNDLNLGEMVPPGHVLLHDLFNHATTMTGTRIDERLILETLADAIACYPDIAKFPSIQEEATLLKDFAPRYDPSTDPQGKASFIIDNLAIALTTLLLKFDQEIMPQCTWVTSALSFGAKSLPRQERRKQERDDRKSQRRLQNQGSRLFDHLIDYLKKNLPRELLTPFRVQAMSEFQGNWSSMSNIFASSSGAWPPTFAAYLRQARLSARIIGTHPFAR
jgi:hypothetical protein